MKAHEQQRGMPVLRRELRIHLDHYVIGRAMHDHEVERRARVEIDSIEREIMRCRYGITSHREV